MSECNHNCADCKEECNEKHTNLAFKPHKLSSIKKVIAIASGKGGVGKSSITAMLAVLLRQKGYNTAVLDADITGASIPKMFGVNTKAIGNDEGLLPNDTKTGIKIMSSNLLLKTETDPIVWRGPIIAGLVKQFWTDVIWQDIDFLFVDMPPGTGDVPLTVFQSFSVDGIIIVTTPQELVSMIVTKAVKMAKMMDIPIIGIIENQSYVECDECKHQIKLYGESNVEKIANEFGLKVLAKLPIDSKITTLCNQGKIEDLKVNYLDQVVLTLEDLPVNVLTVAMPIEDGHISSHFGKAKTFYIYQLVKNMIIYGFKINVETEEHQAIVDSLVANKVNVILTTKIGDQMVNLLHKKKISVINNITGDPLEAIHQYLDKAMPTTEEGNCDGCDCEDECEEESCSHCSHK